MRPALADRSAPWRTASVDWFSEVEQRRALFARVIGGDADGVALIPATSYGLAIAARNATAGPGHRVLLIADEYPSTVYTWRAFAAQSGAEVITVARDEQQSWTDAVLAALDERVRVISVPNVRWTDGGLIDLKLVGARARELGALFVVDVTQSLGAMPFELSTVLPDFWRRVTSGCSARSALPTSGSRLSTVVACRLSRTGSTDPALRTSRV